MHNPYDNARDGKSSVLGPTLKFKGELTAEEDLLILGRVEGSIKHSSSLTIGDGGSVKADVSAEYIVVEGSVDGDLRGSKCVKIRESAKVNGNLISPSVSLVEGATFNGKIDMDGDPKASVEKRPQSKPAQDAVAEADDSDKQAEEAAAAEEAPEAEGKQAADKKQARPDKKSANAA